MSFLLDTNVVSEMRKGGNANPALANWFAVNRDEGFFLSALVIGEIRKGIEMLRRSDSDSARAIDGWLEETCSRFGGRIIPVDQEIAEEWGRISASDPLPAMAGLMAATAAVRGLTLATRNVADIERTGVRHVNPFA